MRKKIMVVSLLAATIFACAAAIRPGKAAAGGFTNLKVLPANISSAALSAIMVDEFQDELGVSCNFCHAENKETHKPDYASDEKPEKEIARAMMRMTMEVNDKYFGAEHAMIGDSVLSVNCGTCHHGQSHPDNGIAQ